MIERDEVIELARKYAQDQGWPFDEPVYLEEGRLLFSRGRKPRIVKLWTNGTDLGTKAWFEIDREAGQVIAAGYIPL